MTDDRETKWECLKIGCDGGELFWDAPVCKNIATHFDVAGHRVYLCDACFARAVAQVMQDGMLIWKIPF